MYICTIINRKKKTMIKDVRIPNEKTYCNNCGSILGIDCGEAEADYNENFCSKGCYKEARKFWSVLNKTKEINKTK